MAEPSTLTQYPAEWLAVRADADAAARAVGLLDPLRSYLANDERRRRKLVIRDLGCGTGAMGRWLTGRLPWPPHWILTDRDPGLLARAVTSLPSPATAVTELRDITTLTAADLAGTSLVTGSALLDLLTAGEVAGLAAACVEAGCPALLVLSVVGRVELDPADPLDAELAAAFNAHQRRTSNGRRLLGPDAVDVASEAFGQQGAVVYRQPSPWRLGQQQVTLIGQWLRGWVAVAREQRPDLARSADAYLRRRLAECAAGELRATIHHEDLLALPARPVDG